MLGRIHRMVCSATLICNHTSSWTMRIPRTLLAQISVSLKKEKHSSR
jgi:hypothetical protein